MSLLRNFCFTWNNYPANANAQLTAFSERCVYLVYGREVGESGTPHLQGYAELTKQTRFMTIKKILHSCWIGQRKGTQEDAIKYCKKDHDFTEIGEPRSQGERTDLDKARNLAIEGGMRAVSATCNYQQIRTAEKFLTYNEEPRTEKPYVVYVWGKTGTGKSVAAEEFCKEAYSDDIYVKCDKSQWWDGYDGHECVILSDWRDSWFDLSYMLNLIDWTPMQVQIKGGYRQMRAKVIVITTSQNPNFCYIGTGERTDQFKRRLDLTVEMIGHHWENKNENFSPVTNVTEVGGNTRAPTS